MLAMRFAGLAAALLVLGSVAPASAEPAVGGRGAVDGGALYLRGAWVPEVQGAELGFAGLQLDVDLGEITPPPFVGVRGRGAASQGLRLELSGLGSRVAVEGRSALGVGNLRLSWWLRWRSRGGRTATAIALGTGLPLGHWVGLATRVMEERAEISVPGYSGWLRVVHTWRRPRWALQLDGELGYQRGVQSYSGLIARLAFTWTWRFSEALSLPIGVCVPANFDHPNESAVLGLRWRPGAHLIASLGVHAYHEGFRPVGDLTWRF